MEISLEDLWIRRLIVGTVCVVDRERDGSGRLRDDVTKDQVSSGMVKRWRINKEAREIIIIIGGQSKFEMMESPLGKRY